MKVYNDLGSGFMEAVYEEVLEKEFRAAKISFERQKRLKLYYKDMPLDKYYRADFVIEERVILEIKSTQYIVMNHMKQLRNYLKATNMRLGLLINFGAPSLEFRRVLNNIT